MSSDQAVSGPSCGPAAPVDTVDSGNTASSHGPEDDVQYQMGVVGIQERRLPLECIAFGTCWLLYIGGGSLARQGKAGQTDAASCRALYKATETEKEKAAREKEGISLARMVKWPRWVRLARKAAGRLTDLEKRGLGPSITMRKEFPAGQVRDLAPMTRQLLDLAFNSGLQKDTVSAFTKWLGKLICNIIVVYCVY
jgi:hypothetical protein